jgi:hypothetical protein
MMEVKSGLRVLSILVLLICCISCGDSVTESKILLIGFTDKNEYKLSEEITYTIVNYSNINAYVKMCDHLNLIWIEIKTNGNWEIYWTPVVPTFCMTNSKKLAPKEQMEWSNLLIDEAGNYRIAIPEVSGDYVERVNIIYTNEFLVKE